MKYLRHVQAAVFACARSDRSIGEVHARACKRLGYSDPMCVRLTLCRLVRGQMGRDQGSLPTRRARRRRAWIEPGELR